MDKETLTDRICDREMALLELAGRHDRLLHGQCHLFALALREVSGAPLGAYLEVGYSEKGRPCHCLVHAFVKVDGFYVDLRGPFRTQREFLEEFPLEMDGWEVVATARKLLNMGEGDPKRTQKVRAQIADLLPLATEVWELTQQQIEDMKQEIQCCNTD